MSGKPFEDEGARATRGTAAGGVLAAAEERLRQGCMLLEKGQLHEALIALDEAIALDPTNARAHNKRGVALAEKGMLDEAEQAFDAALAANPRYTSAMCNLGNVYRERNMLDKALELYENVLSIDPDHATAHHNLGVTYRQVGMLDKAVAHLKRAQWLDLRRDVQRNRLSGRVGRYLWIAAAAVIAACLLILRK